MVKQELTVPVRALVEHVHRTGDLNMTSFGTGQQVDAIRAHQAIQSSRPLCYSPEVSISHRIENHDIALTIRGRIDGVYRYDDHAVIEEIKTTNKPLNELAGNDNPLHWAQLTCYAAMFAREEEISVTKIQLTYYHLPSGDIREIQRDTTHTELDRFLDTTVTAYLLWASTVAAWRIQRDSSVLALDFPFDGYRVGQRELAVDVWGTIRVKGQLAVEAPTGTGKTMAVLFPAIKALGSGYTDMLFYLTARTIGRTAAESALNRLRENGLSLKSVTLTAKDKVCPVPGSACNGEECPYASAYYERLPDAREEAFRQDSWTRDVVTAIALKHTLCPFEFSLELTLWADCVICDYNYAFDPRVYLRRFFQEDCGEYVFLVDEAHNLVDRSREMFSAELTKAPALALRRSLKAALPDVYRALGSVNRCFLDARKRCEGDLPVKEPSAPGDLAHALRRFTAAADRWLERNEPAPFREELLEYYFAAITFLRVIDRYDETYTTFLIPDGRDLTVRLYCLNPAPQMTEAFKRCIAAVFFSATMTPLDYFRTTLGLDENVYELDLPDPFPPGHRCVMIAENISTRYHDRERTRTQVTDCLAGLVQAHRGNYLFYFPSYEYLSRVHESFVSSCPEVETLVQERFMSEEDREHFVAQFIHEPESTLVGFAVMGGIFGEGIDLIGKRLSGAAIVGVGLPGISPEREAIRAYMDRSNRRGFDIAYRFPGVNRVLQAAGRVIRTETDRGIILLVDERFAAAEYRLLLPSFWDMQQVTTPEEIRNSAAQFWNNTGLT